MKLLFAEHFDDQYFMTALVSDIGFDTMDNFYNYLDFSNDDGKQVGRPHASIGVKKIIRTMNQKEYHVKLLRVVQIIYLFPGKYPT